MAVWSNWITVTIIFLGLIWNCHLCLHLLIPFPVKINPRLLLLPFQFHITVTVQCSGGKQWNTSIIHFAALKFKSASTETADAFPQAVSSEGHALESSLAWRGREDKCFTWKIFFHLAHMAVYYGSCSQDERHRSFASLNCAVLEVNSDLLEVTL